MTKDFMKYMIRLNKRELKKETNPIQIETLKIQIAYFQKKLNKWIDIEFLMTVAVSCSVAFDEETKVGVLPGVIVSSISYRCNFGNGC